MNAHSTLLPYVSSQLFPDIQAFVDKLVKRKEGENKNKVYMCLCVEND